MILLALGALRELLGVDEDAPGLGGFREGNRAPVCLTLCYTLGPEAKRAQTLASNSLGSNPGSTP